MSVRDRKIREVHFRAFSVHALAFALLGFGARLSAQCPANLSVSPPDSNGIVTVVASTTGACGAASLHLTLDGGILTGADCPNPALCSLTTTIDAKCLGAGTPNGGLTHTVGLTTNCQHNSTDQQGHPTCADSTAGSNSGTFTIAPKPTVSVSYDGPDEQGHGTAHVNYTFRYNETFGIVRVYFDGDGQDCPYCSFPSGTWAVPHDFTCATPGAHEVKATALACGSPQGEPRERRIHRHRHHKRERRRPDDDQWLVR